MFSTKIYVLSVFVFSLLNLGQAAPIIDEVSSLSTREVESTILDARGLFDFLYKRDVAADNVHDIGTCHLYNTYKNVETEHENFLKDINGKMSNSTLSKSEKNAYKKLSHMFTKKVKDAKKRVAKQVKTLKKHKKDVTACAPPSTPHTDAKTDVKTDSPKSDSPNQHKLAATSHQDPPAPSPSSDAKEQ